MRELAAHGIAMAVACRVLSVSRSGYYDWRRRRPSARAVVDTALTPWTEHRRIYEPRRLTAEVRDREHAWTASGSPG